MTVHAFVPKDKNLVPPTDIQEASCFYSNWRRLITCQYNLDHNVVVRALQNFTDMPHSTNLDDIDPVAPWDVFYDVVDRRIEQMLALSPFGIEVLETRKQQRQQYAVTDVALPLGANILEEELRQYCTALICYELLLQFLPEEAVTASCQATCRSFNAAFNLLNLVDQSKQIELQEHTRQALAALWHGPEKPFVVYDEIDREGELNPRELAVQTLYNLHEALNQQCAAATDTELDISANLDLTSHLQRESTLQTLWVALMKYQRPYGEFRTAMLAANALLEKIEEAEEPTGVVEVTGV